MAPLSQHDTTAFGAPWLPLGRAASTLRARASRHGVRLAGTAEVDLAAAVIAADAWVVALDAEGLDRPMRYGFAAAEALTRVLARAAGCADGTSPGEEELEVVAAGGGLPPERWLEAAARWDAWLEELGLDPGQVFSRVVCDLVTGDERLRQVAAMLLADLPPG